MIETYLKYFAIFILAWQQTAVTDISKRPDGPANISFQSRTCSRAGRLARSELQCRFGIQHLHHTAQRQALRKSQQSLPHAIVSSSHNDLWLEIRVGVLGWFETICGSSICLVLLLPTDVFLKHSIHPAPIPKPLLDSDAVCTLSMAMRWTTNAKLDIFTSAQKPNALSALFSRLLTRDDAIAWLEMV